MLNPIGADLPSCPSLFWINQAHGAVNRQANQKSARAISRLRPHLSGIAGRPLAGKLKMGEDEVR